MHLLVVGGGSAGHVIPARPVMQRFLAAGHRVSFVGTKSGLEERLVNDLDVEYYGIISGKLRRYFSFENVLDAIRVLVGMVQALALLLRLRPSVVFSKGGFVSFPVVFAAWICRVPVVAHESDLSPGLANRLVKPFVDTFCLSFAATRIQTQARVVHTGTPIRDEISQADGERGRHKIGVATAVPLLVITGGSLGADRLNEVVRAALPQLIQRFHVVHVVGPGKRVAHTEARYQQEEYIDQGWGDILAAADVVISRAGANALFELLALRKRMLLVPLPKGVSRGDQIENAAYAASNGLAVVVDQGELTPTRLLAAIEQLESRVAQIESALAEFSLPPAIDLIVREIEAVSASTD